MIAVFGRPRFTPEGAATVVNGENKNIVNKHKFY